MRKPADRDRQRERRAFGERLALLRGRMKLSQDRVAEALGVRRATVTAWEGGDSEPLALDLQALADLLGVDMAVLTGRVPLPRPE